MFYSHFQEKLLKVILVISNIFGTMCAYKCNNCGKVFNRKENFTYHEKNNVCAKKTFCCGYCPNKFTSKVGMYNHMRDVCKVKKLNDAKNEDILIRLVQMEEETKRLRSDNEKLKSDERLAKLEETTKKLKEDNKKLKKENEKMKRVIKTTDKPQNIKNNTINGNVNNGNINNGDVNNGNINNGDVNNGTVINATITLVGYGNEDLSKLDKSEIFKALQTGYNSTVKLTEAVHFNPDFPEYHNIYISNMKDKYAMMHDGKQWTLTTKEDLISKIYDDKRSYIEENLEEFVQSLHPSRKRALARWLDTDDEDAKVKEIKENIKLLLYNSKNMVIENKEAKKSKSIKVIKDTQKSIYILEDNNSAESESQSEDIVHEPKTVKVVKREPKKKTPNRSSTHSIKVSKNT
jgi:hypothetical protein